MNSRYLYLKSTANDGTVTFSEHVCWDSDLFYRSRQAETVAANDRVLRDTGKPPATFAAVEPITRAQYVARKA